MRLPAAGGGSGGGRSLASLAGGESDLRGPAAELLSRQQQQQQVEGDGKPDFSKMFPKRQVRDWSAQGAAKYGTPPEASLRSGDDDSAAGDAADAREQRAERLDTHIGGGAGGGGQACFNCGEIGHKSRDCPQGGGGGGGGGQACFNCGEIGHISRECPQGGGEGGGGGGGGGQACFTCGEVGHKSRDCPQGGGSEGGGGGGGGRSRPAPTYEDGRYVSAYSSEQSEFLTTDSAKIAAKGDAALDDYAKMVEFSRHRREQLKASGQERRSGGTPAALGILLLSVASVVNAQVCSHREAFTNHLRLRRPGRGGRNGKGKQSAPRAFGTNDHGPGMRPDEDLPGGERVDEEGMVYSLDGGSRTVYFCDRFRRYKFYGKAGGLALLQAMCTKNDTCLGLNAKLFSADPEVHSRCWSRCVC